LWIGFLLVCVLSGFGVVAYQLQRTNRLTEIDQELERRVAAISTVFRVGPSSFFPFGPGPGGPGFEDHGRRSSPSRERSSNAFPDGFPAWPGDPSGSRGRFKPGPDGFKEIRAALREVRLPAVSRSFDETRRMVITVTWFSTAAGCGAHQCA
jgi:hypothetical protein